MPEAAVTAVSPELQPAAFPAAAADTRRLIPRADSRAEEPMPVRADIWAAPATFMDGQVIADITEEDSTWVLAPMAGILTTDIRTTAATPTIRAMPMDQTMGTIRVMGTIRLMGTIRVIHRRRRPHHRPAPLGINTVTAIPVSSCILILRSRAFNSRRSSNKLRNRSSFERLVVFGTNRASLE
jgi:hypothetical protein